MKIAIINSYYFPDEPGGAERSVRILAEGLVDAGHEVLVVTLSETFSATSIRNVEVVRFPIRNSYLPLNAPNPSVISRMLWHTKDSYNRDMAKVVSNHIERWQADVVHTNNLSGISVAVWSELKRVGMPLVHTARDFYLLCPKTTMMKNSQQCDAICADCKCFSLPRKHAVKLVDRFVAISDFMRAHHLHKGFVKAKKTTVIYNAYCNLNAKTAHQLNGPVTVGFIGRLVPTKGIAMLINAAHLLKARGLEICLSIAGTGDKAYVDQLKEAALGLNVRFWGQVEPADFFAEIDCLAVPSLWHEPMGRVAIESIAHGKPLVVSPMGGLPELVQPEFSELAASTEVADFADALAKLINRMGHEYQTMQEAAYQASANYSVEMMVANYLVEYQRAIDSATVPVASVTQVS
ncbi:glycosyltransferase family 4 protein [Neiella marina]|uniref:Glycosyltransferase family 4 protein n=1 Tax=Neiella holothuriorum TaxID=2870530 RepID=A0ABS7EEC6_9GAMM|nr:glycosyltransferase family 4 protein [Neiella holothuriorum]MBW8190574.1 glycosyltransferase family 4 protein [Neiella holothuriorum]